MTEPVSALSSAQSATPDLDQARRPRRPIPPFDFWLVYFASAAIAGIAIVPLAHASPVIIGCVAAMSGVATIIIDRLVLAPRAGRQFNDAVLVAQEAHVRGNHDEAEKVFLQAAKRFRGRGGLQARALVGAAAMRLALCDLVGARKMFVALNNFSGTPMMPGLLYEIRIWLCIIATIEGSIDEARSWFTSARTCNLPVKVYDSNIESLILAREGRYQDALTACEREWADLERVTPALNMRDLYARRAFVHERAGADAGALAKLIAAAKPRLPDEFAYLATRWPEMREFLERNALLGDAEIERPRL